MKRFMNKKVAAIGLAAGLALGAAGAAFAYFTSTGSGTGTGSVTAGSSDLTYTQNVLTAMYPGDSTQPLTVTVHNNSTTQNEFVGGVSAYITTSNAGCTGGDFLIDGVAAPSTALTAVPLTFTGVEVAANGGTASTSGDTIQFNDKANVNQDLCKSVTVTLHYAS
jgi:hypothetical protein